MPEASTGGPEGRGNTQPSGGTGIPVGRTRIDLAGDGSVTFMNSAGIFTDLVVEVMSDYDTMTYRCDSGRTWTVPRTWRSGDTIPSIEITWTATRTNGGRVRAYGNAAFNPRIYADQVDQAWGAGRAQVNYTFDNNPYAVGGYIPPLTPIAYGGCDCVICRGAERYANSGVRRTDADIERYNQRAREEAQQAEKARRAAEVRAEEMLRMVLLPDELAHYDETKEIIVTGADGKRYQIWDGLIGNVWLLNDAGDDKLATFCCHPRLYPADALNANEALPFRDAHAAQVLYLRYDLEKFWAKANISWYDQSTKNEYLLRRGRTTPGGRDRWLFGSGV